MSRGFRPQAMRPSWRSEHWYTLIYTYQNECWCRIQTSHLKRKNWYSEATYTVVRQLFLSVFNNLYYGRSTRVCVHVHICACVHACGPSPLQPNNLHVLSGFSLILPVVYCTNRRLGAVCVSGIFDGTRGHSRETSKFVEKSWGGKVWLIWASPKFILSGVHFCLVFNPFECVLFLIY